jgi:hypothetical protein
MASASWCSVPCTRQWPVLRLQPQLTIIRLALTLLALLASKAAFAAAFAADASASSTIGEYAGSDPLATSTPAAAQAKQFPNQALREQILLQRVSIAQKSLGSGDDDGQAAPQGSGDVAATTAHEYIARSLVKDEGESVTPIEYNTPLQACMRHCDSHPDCRSFAYSELQQACFLKGTEIYPTDLAKEGGYLDYLTYMQGRAVPAGDGDDSCGDGAACEPVEEIDWVTSWSAPPSEQRLDEHELSYDELLVDADDFEVEVFNDEDDDEDESHSGADRGEEEEYNPPCNSTSDCLVFCTEALPAEVCLAQEHHITCEQLSDTDDLLGSKVCKLMHFMRNGSKATVTTTQAWALNATAHVGQVANRSNSTGQAWPAASGSHDSAEGISYLQGDRRVSMTSTDAASTSDLYESLLRLGAAKRRKSRPTASLALVTEEEHAQYAATSSQCTGCWCFGESVAKCTGTLVQDALRCGSSIFSAVQYNRRRRFWGSVSFNWTQVAKSCTRWGPCHWGNSVQQCFGQIASSIGGSVKEVVDCITDLGCDSVDSCLDMLKGKAECALRLAIGPIREAYNGFVSLLPQQMSALMDNPYVKAVQVGRAARTYLADVVGDLKALLTEGDFSPGSSCMPGMWSLAPTDCGAFAEVRNIFKEPHKGPYYLRQALDKLGSCTFKRGILNLPSPFLEFSVDDDVCLPKFVDQAMEKIRTSPTLLEHIKAILAQESVSLIQEVEASNQTSGMPQVWFVKVWVGVSIPVALDLDLEVKVGQVFGRRWKKNGYEDISLADTLLIGGGLTGSTSAIRHSVPKKHSNTTVHPDAGAFLRAQNDNVTRAHQELVGFQICLHSGCWETPSWSVDGGIYAAGNLFGADAEFALTAGSLVSASGLTDSVGWGPTFYFGADNATPARAGIKGGLGVEHMVSFPSHR